MAIKEKLRRIGINLGAARSMGNHYIRRSPESLKLESGENFPWRPDSFTEPWRSELEEKYGNTSRDKLIFRWLINIHDFGESFCEIVVNEDVVVPYSSWSGKVVIEEERAGSHNDIETSRHSAWARAMREVSGHMYEHEDGRVFCVIEHMWGFELKELKRTR